MEMLLESCWADVVKKERRLSWATPVARELGLVSKQAAAVRTELGALLDEVGALEKRSEAAGLMPLSSSSLPSLPLLLLLLLSCSRCPHVYARSQAVCKVLCSCVRSSWCNVLVRVHDRGFT